MLDNFAVFIITYKRPDKQITYDTLRRCGYSGKIYLVVDDTDPTIQQYIDNYGADNIFVFDKNYYINSDRFDNSINDGIYASAVYARRAVEDIVQSMKLPYFAVADDDIVDFVIRYPIDKGLKRYKITDFDVILRGYIEILDCGVACVGFGRPNSYFGGAVAFSAVNLCKRVITTTFFIRNSDVPVNWLSWTMEDDITVLRGSTVGELWLSIPYIQQVNSDITNLQGSGGNVELYQKYSWYYICFTELKYIPSRIQIKCDDLCNMNSKSMVLLRHTDKCYPKIMSSYYRKEK